MFQQMPSPRMGAPSVSVRLVEELLERGNVISYETIRRQGWKFGPAYAK